MSRRQLKKQVRKLVGAARPHSFRDRMLLQMQVVETLARRWHKPPLAVVRKVAPVFGQVVPHV